MKNFCLCGPVAGSRYVRMLKKYDVDGRSILHYLA